MIVQSSASPKRVNASSARSRSAARARAVSRANAPAGAAATPAVGAGAAGGHKESAFGHVDGMVATRSATGTKTDAPLIETPIAISVVTQDQIQAQGAQSIAQAVRYTSGVRSENLGADARFDNIYIRGFLADQYLDSLRLLNFGVFAYPIVEPFNLERIEILHGPASVLYGQSSPGGIVDLVSKRPTLEPITRCSCRPAAMAASRRASTFPVQSTRTRSFSTASPRPASMWAARSITPTTSASRSRRR
ncbi:TonB-dependent receptor plug domain-containing protein [Bradyrhizobium japonicum]